MEKRRDPRFAFREPVGYLRTEGLPQNGSLAGDISAGGVRIRVSEFIPLRTILELKLRLPNPDRIVEAKGEVVWIRQVPHSESFEVGIRFLERRYPSFIEDIVRLRKPF